MSNLLIALLLTILLSCNSSKKTTENTTSKKEVELMQNLYRFNVSFISIGSGIDSKAKQAFIEFIRSFEEKNKVKIIYETAPWGREGETDFCFKLSDLNKGNQIKFIADSKDNLKNSKLVRFTENTTCKNDRK